MLRASFYSFGYQDSEQIARATIGAGEIIIRSNLDQDISDLNRDPDKSLEVNEKAALSFSIKNPVKSIRDGIGTVRDVRDTSTEIIDNGGVQSYIENKTQGSSSTSKGTNSND